MHSPYEVLNLYIQTIWQQFLFAVGLQVLCNLIFDSEMRSLAMLFIPLVCHLMTWFHDYLYVFFYYTSFWHILLLWHKASDLWPFLSSLEPSGTIHVRHCSFLEARQFSYYSKLTLYIALIQLKPSHVNREWTQVWQPLKILLTASVCSSSILSQLIPGCVKCL